MTDHEFSGVWVADRPLDPNEGAWGRFVISLDVPESELEPYEWVEEGRFYREFLVPAELLNGPARSTWCRTIDHPIASARPAAGQRHRWQRR